MENFQDIKLEADSKPKTKTNGKRNKAAGHGWELEIIKNLKEIGFDDVVTTRSNSKARDAQKVDIMNKDERKNGFLSFNIQAKNEARPTKYQKHLAEMPKDGGTNVVVFKQTSKAGTTFRKTGEYAIMYLKDWYEYIKIEKQYAELLKLAEALMEYVPEDEREQFLIKFKTK